jgi:3'(2'), 5'-bisphosphate nucleotidase
MDANTLLHLAIKAALFAGEDIMRVYKTDFSFERKADNTPVTLADMLASKRIVEILSVSSIPSISEEEPLPEFELRKTWERVWIIDPLDGTKEFIKKNGEFTVNIALVQNQHPVIGVIYVPVFNQLYFASAETGSYLATGSPDALSELTLTELISLSKKLPLQRLPSTYTLVASRSHLSHEINERISQLKTVYQNVALIHAGSSIKQCWVAEGKAHEYSRLGTTMEWDTAAGQCILEQAGCSLNTFDSNEPLHYNKANPENPFFIARNLN